MQLSEHLSLKNPITP